MFLGMFLLKWLWKVKCGRGSNTDGSVTKAVSDKVRWGDNGEAVRFGFPMCCSLLLWCDTIHHRASASGMQKQRIWKCLRDSSQHSATAIVAVFKKVVFKLFLSATAEYFAGFSSLNEDTLVIWCWAQWKQCIKVPCGGSGYQQNVPIKSNFLSSKNHPGANSLAWLWWARVKGFRIEAAEYGLWYQSWHLGKEIWLSFLISVISGLFFIFAVWFDFCVTPGFSCQVS